MVSGLVLFLTLAASSVESQTTDELRKRYGQPDAERFVVRSAITVTARYARNGRPCELLIEPRHSLMPDQAAPAPMSPETSTKVIDEMVPLNERGPLIRDITFTGGCSSIRVIEYRDVRITRLIACSPGKSNKERAVHIEFKKAACR